MKLQNNRSRNLKNTKNKKVRWMSKTTLIRVLSFMFQFLVLVAFIYALLFMPETSYASVESALSNIKSKLTGIIFPTLSVCGLAVAALSFFTGNERAKQHILYAVLGCAFGFGAQAISDFISQTVR
jgi:type IV secretory pathway VirB2 component (pilin)